MQKLILESPKIRMVCHPDLGGKISSFISINSDRDFLYQDRRQNFDGSISYSHHDISGFDECFPTIAEDICRDDQYEGLNFPDHGFLWNRQWQVLSNTAQRFDLLSEVPEINAHFSRSAELIDDVTVELKYKISYAGQSPLRYVYSAHPLLASGPNVRFLLPDYQGRAYVYHAMQVPEWTPRTWINWPGDAGQAVCSPLVQDRHQLGKVMLPNLSVGSAAVYHDDVQEGLRLNWDVEKLPHLGVLTVLGYDTLGDGYFTNEAFIGLEPTNGIADELEVCELEDKVAVLEPNSDVEFWIQLRLES